MNDIWTKVADLEEVPENGTFLVQHNGKFVCLYNLGGRVYATQDGCTHADASLADGFVYGENIECPLHQGQFHIPTGKAMTAPCTLDLEVYLVRVEGGTIFLRSS